MSSKGEMHRKFGSKDVEFNDLRTKRLTKSQQRRFEERSHLSDPGVTREIEGRDEIEASGSWWDHALVAQDSSGSSESEEEYDKFETSEAPVAQINHRAPLALSPTSTVSSVTEFSSFTRHSEEREQPDRALNAEQKPSNTMISDELLQIAEDSSVIFEGSVASSSKQSRTKISDQLLRIAEEDSVIFEGSVASSSKQSKSKISDQLLRIAEEDSVIFEGSVASQSAYRGALPRSPQKKRTPNDQSRSVVENNYSFNRNGRYVTKEMHESVNLLENIIQTEEEGMANAKAKLVETPHSQKGCENDQSATQKSSDDKKGDFEKLLVRQGNDEIPMENIQDNFDRVRKRQRRWLCASAILVFCIGIAGVVLLFVVAPNSTKNSRYNSLGERVSERERVKALREAAESISGVEILSDALSPQSMALEWITENDNARESSYAELVQRYVVAVLYFSTTGRAWSEQCRFLTKSSFCEWTEASNTNGDLVNGIECDDGFNIKKIILQDNNLEGVIPKELANLTSLEVLKLSGNKIQGEIPSEMGLLTNLVEFDILLNNVGGEIPSEFGFLINLENLDLSSNSLTGTLPTEIGRLTLLQRISVGDNQLMGTIPSTMASLMNLSTLNVFHNNLQGTVPDALGNLPLLKTVNVASNKFTGDLNPGFCSLVVHQYDAFWADCRGNEPQVECECCTICCKEENGDLEC